ncbi:MAG: cob(I)yrinic acid a,c-diamide adenosyltransferase [Candidatus Berkelbacteria bacterium]|nr:cob(I)yrinic acid a,c-diamide adenosyltransferase [Candidatus Berkelbacteria bacterium]
MIIVYSGNGKGKSTAAFGLAIRAAGWGKKVAIVQFIKGYKNTGEWKFFSRIPEIDIFQSFDDETMSIGEPTKIHKKNAFKSLAQAKEIIESKKYDVVILDEINNAVFYHLVEAGEMIKILKTAPAELDIVLTGRNAPSEFIKIADLVSEIKNIKHPFDSGKPAKKGIDY